MVGCYCLEGISSSLLALCASSFLISWSSAMKLSRLYMLAVMCLFASASVSWAQDAAGSASMHEPFSCGAPIEELPFEEHKDHFEMCDFYSRQIGYKAKADAFYEKLVRRQENFAAPRRAIEEKYRADIRNLHGFN